MLYLHQQIPGLSLDRWTCGDQWSSRCKSSSLIAAGARQRRCTGQTCQGSNTSRSGQESITASLETLLLTLCNRSVKAAKMGVRQQLLVLTYRA